jgi:hypothetical protein
VGPSVGRFLPNYVEPREMTVSDIQAVVQAFGDAAARAVKAGFGECHTQTRWRCEMCLVLMSCV